VSIFRPATHREVEWIASRLRPEDRREIETVSGRSPEAVLPEVFSSTDHVFTIRAKRTDEPACLFGITPGADATAAIWLVATPEVRSVGRALLTEAHYWLRGWAELYTLINVVDSRNDLHLEWLETMGFLFGEPVEINDVPFLPIRYPEPDHV
jgi:hypothetical protein